MKGYTLIEILVALTLVGLIFRLGFANFRDFSRRQALAGVAKDLQGDLRLTQEMALSGKKPAHVFCNSPNVLNDYQFAVVSATQYVVQAGCSGGDQAVVVKTVDLPSGITMTTPTPNPIRFKVLGQGMNIPSGGSASIILTQAGTSNRITITVTAGGEIK